MYPRAFFDTYWRGNVRNEVFVAMSFAAEFNDVYSEAIKPAIRSLGMEVNRANDPARSGCLLTRILDGIGHAKLVFVDISVMTMEPWKGQRNANVMYELGVAHALRPETDLIVVRSDNQRLNFDIGAIQVRSYPREDLSAARAQFTAWIQSGLEERNMMMSLIIERARQRLDQASLKAMMDCWNAHKFQPFKTDDVGAEQRAAIPRLLDLDIIRCEILPGNQYQYSWTEFGIAAFNKPNLAK